MLDEQYMRLAIQLAESVKGQTTPNPPVGAVVVKNGAIVGMGAHLREGEDHAEKIALKMAGDRAKHATLYVTLEPCSHHGKTPPCVDEILEKEITCVFIACQDRNSKVNGRGIKILRNAGIEVKIGFLAAEAAGLYDKFFHFIRTKRPFVTMKVATSLDGKIATKTFESKWITNETARQDVHRYRHEHDAILVGVNTVIKDNPRLTTRIRGGRNPLRVILDTHLRTPLDAHVVQDTEAETWIVVGNHVTSARKRKYLNETVRIISMEQDKIYAEKVLALLGAENITSVFVEGGATVNGSFLEAGCVDQYVLYLAPILIGGMQAPTSITGIGIDRLSDALSLEIKQVTMIEDNVKIVADRKG